VSETRKLAAILVSDVVGYSRLAGADEDRILACLRTLRSDLIDPTMMPASGLSRTPRPVRRLGAVDLGRPRTGRRRPRPMVRLRAPTPAVLGWI